MIKGKDNLLVPFIIIGGKLFSFVFNALLGSYYGAGQISDAFILAHSIPTIVFEGFATAIISCYIPVQRTIVHESPEKLKKYNGNMMLVSFAISAIITLLYYVFRHSINRIYAGGFDAHSLELLDGYSGILIWSVPVIGIYCIFRAHLQVCNKKTISSIHQILCYFVMILAVVCFFPNDKALAWATLAGNILCLLILGATAYRTGFRMEPGLSLRETYVKNTLLLIFPIVVSTLVSEIASVIDKYFASYYSDGIITGMTYGYQLSFAMQGIVSTSLLIIIFPLLSDSAAKKDYSEFNRSIYISMEAVSWIVLPMVVGGILLSYPVIRLLFEHGNFSHDSALMTASVFSCYLLGVLPMCIKHICDKSFYALQKTKVAMITAGVIVVTNIVLDYFLNIVMGYMGLVLATGISIVIGTILSVYLLKRMDNGLSVRRLVYGIIQPVIPTAVMGLTVLAIKRVPDISERFPSQSLIGFAICVIAGVLAYLLVILLFYRKRIRSLISDERA